MTTIYSYNAEKNRLVTVGTKSYAYDANGNVTSDGTYTYVWGDDNKLKEVKQGTTTIASFTYDALGKRETMTTADGVTKTFHYDGDAVSYVTESSGKIYRFSYDHAGKPIFMSYQNQQYWYIYDEHGNVIRMTDSNGDTVASYKYDAWGNITSKTGNGTEIVDLNPYRYAGYWYDKETSKYYLKARYYVSVKCINNGNPAHYISREFLLLREAVILDAISWLWKSALLAIVGMVLLRIAGRKSVAQMSIATTVITISIGTIIVQPLANSEIRKAACSAAVFIAALLIVEYLQVKFDWFEKLVSGRSKIIIENGQIVVQNMRSARLTVDQLEMRLRENGVSNISDVKFTTLEPNGQLGYELMRDAKPVTIGELERILGLKSGAAMEQSSLFQEVKINHHPAPIDPDLQ